MRHSVNQVTPRDKWLNNQWAREVKELTAHAKDMAVRQVVLLNGLIRLKPGMKQVSVTSLLLPTASAINW